MKTAVSMPDALFVEAERTARRLGMSRSELFAKAVAAFVDAHQGRRITEALDRVYAATEAGLDPVLDELQRRSLRSNTQPW